jgi:flagellar hook-length control protein FliK
MRRANDLALRQPGIPVGGDEDSLTMYASLAIPPPAQSQPATAPAPPAGEAQGFGEALRRAAAAPASVPVLGAALAEAFATPATATASPTGILDLTEAVDPAALLPAALTLAVTEIAPASPAKAEAATETPEVAEGLNPDQPKPDGIATIPGLVMAPMPLPPPPPLPPAAATAPTTPELALSASAMPTSPQPKPAPQRGTATAVLPQAEHGLHAAEAAPQTTPLLAQPASLPPLLPALPPVAHEFGLHAPPHAVVGQAEATAGPEAPAALLSAMHQATGEALREAPRAAPMPPARQVMPMAMAMLLSPGATPTLSVTLDPAELGRLEIRVGREAGGASLRLITERPETLSLLVRDQRDLQQGLAQSGITLNADGIRFEMAEQDGHARQEQQRRPGGRSRPLAETNSANPQQIVQLSLLDIRI